jgi:hypothetical protein
VPVPVQRAEFRAEGHAMTRTATALQARTSSSPGGGRRPGVGIGAERRLQEQRGHLPGRSPTHTTAHAATPARSSGPVGSASDPAETRQAIMMRSQKS